MAALPIIDWSDNDVWLYILSNNLPFNEAYKQGCARVGCWCCPNNGPWSSFLSSIYMPDEYKSFNKILYDFALTTGKHDIDEYVKEGEWKKRQGGEGLEKSKNTVMSFKPCSIDKRTFNFSISKPITEELYTFFTPFGYVNTFIGNKSLNEVYILQRETNKPLLSIRGYLGTYELKVSVLDTDGRFKDLKKALTYIKNQLNKYSLCISCSACSQVCKHHAIVTHSDEKTGEVIYTIDVKKCVGCLDCVTHFSGGCYMNKVLRIRKGNGNE